MYTITKDHFANRLLSDAFPRSMSQQDIINHPDAKQFRMFDADGVLMFSGFVVRDIEPQRFGCTEIEIKEKGSWRRK